MLLTGTYPRTLDDKSRLSLPKKVRDVLGNPSVLFVSPGQDGCLALFSQESLERLAYNLDRQHATDAEVGAFRRMYFAQTETVDVDRAGRILIPDRLLDSSDLEDDLVLLGVGDHVELWNAKAWQRYRTRNASRFDAVAEEAFHRKD